MDSFNAQVARQYIQSLGLKREDVQTPYWPDLDGHVTLQDIPSDELVMLNSNPLVKDDQGKFSVPRFMSVLLCKSLVIKDTGELIFPVSLTDFANRDIVVGLGGSVLSPVFQQAQKFFGMSDEKAIEEAKKNLIATLSGSTGTV